MSAIIAQLPEAREFNVGRSVLFGLAAGIAGGAAFGLIMVVATPMVLPLIGKLIGFEGMPGGWLYHLFNSLVIGSIFGLILGRVTTGYASGALWGGLYGVVWWVLGGLILLPLMLGMNSMVFAINTVSLLSLVGHLVFGVITGVVYVRLRATRR